MLKARDTPLDVAEEEAVDTVCGAIRHWARERASARFCTFVARDSQTSISFAQLYERSRAYADYYRERGVGAGDLVIIILQHSEHLYYSYLGAMLVGAVPSFLAYPTPKQRPEVYWAEHKVLFDRITPRLIVTYAANAASACDLLRCSPATLAIAGDDVLRSRGSDATDDAVCAPDGVACLQHSSGTTGSKKGVMLTHRAIVAAVRAYAAALDATAADVVASWLPLYHDMGFVACFMSAVVNGTHLVALDPFEWVARPTLLLDAIEAHGATLCWLPNFAFSHIVNAAKSDRRWNLGSMRAFINCSEPCRVETMERFAARFADSGVSLRMLHVCYALAENVFGVTQTPLTKPARWVRVDSAAFRAGRIVPAAARADGLRLVSSGSALDGTQIEIRSAAGGVAPAGEVGHIFIRGACLFAGYYRLPERSRRALADGWYATGDLGFWDAGELFVTGRIDDMIVVNGRNFYAHEIEAIVSDVPGVVPGRAVALGVVATQADATVVALVIEARTGVVETELKAAVRGRVFDTLALAVHSIVLVGAGALLKTTSGKISRGANAERFVATANGYRLAGPG